MARLSITLVSHPLLLRTDAESVRVLLRLYDQYSTEFIGRAQQLAASSAITTEVT